MLLTLVTFFSCTPEEDNLFEESSANRVEASIKAAQEVLTAPTNGWLMEYYPSSIQEYGGYNILLSFSAEGKVTASCEVYGATDVYTSLYSVKQSAGAVLTFDTYNPLIHFFSDPKNPIGIGSNGKGMEGDYEFTILNVEANRIVLKGKKTGAIVKMTPLATDLKWDTYISSLQTFESQLAYSIYEFQINEKRIDVQSSYRNLKFSFEKGGEIVTVSAPYILTTKGYKFYTPLELEGAIIDGFDYVADGDYFTPANGVDAKLVPVIPPLSMQLANGKWYFAYSGLSPIIQKDWDLCKKVFDSPAVGETLYYAYLGAFTDGKYGFCFASTPDMAALYGGALHLGANLISENEIEFTFPGTASGDGAWYWTNGKLEYIVAPVIGTFTLTADNPANPSWIKMQSKKNAAVHMTLYKKAMYFPYEQ